MLISIIRNKVFWSVLIIIKLTIFYFFGVQLMPDSSSYIELSEDIEKEISTIFQFEDRSRMIGYPLIIYLLKLISTDNWLNLIGVLQLTFSVFTLFYIDKTLKKLEISSLSSKLIIVIFTFSTINKLDLLLLTDSIYGNLLILIFCNFFLILKEKKKKEIINHCIKIGLLLSLSFLIKDTTVIILPIFLLFFSFIIVKYFKRKLNLKNCFFCFFLIFLPTITISEIIKYNNYVKNNHKYSTIGGSTIYLYATAKPYLDRDLKTFDDSNDYNRTYKKYVKDLSFSNIYNAIHDLQKQGYSRVDILKYSKEKYFEIILDPLNLFNIIMWNMKPTFIWGVFQPTLSVSQLYSLKINDNSYWRTRLIFKEVSQEKNLNFKALLLSFCLIEILFSTILLIMFIKVTLTLFKKFIINMKKSFFLNDKNVIILVSTSFYLLFCFLHLIVHMEPRYMVGVNFLFIISIIIFYDNLIFNFLKKYNKNRYILK